MNELQKYLFETLGMVINIKPLREKNLTVLPFYLRSLYQLKEVRLFDRKIILLQQNDNEYLTADQYFKHIRQIEQIYNLPVVLIKEQIEAYNRKRLIEKQVAFIIPGKQMFIPQILIDIKEFRNATNKKKEKIQPAAQCLLFYHLLKENVEKMNFKTIAEKINYTQMTITRAAADLAEKKICRIEGRKEKQVIFEANRRTIWERAKPFLRNPLKRKIFPEDYLNNDLMYKAGYFALSLYTNLSNEPIDCYAATRTDYMDLKKNRQLKTTNKIERQFSIEIWEYAPGLLAEKSIVDPLSLYMTLKDVKDERVELEIEKMIERLW